MGTDGSPVGSMAIWGSVETLSKFGYCCAAACALRRERETVWLSVSVGVGCGIVALLPFESLGFACQRLE